MAYWCGWTQKDWNQSHGLALDLSRSKWQEILQQQATTTTPKVASIETAVW